MAATTTATTQRSQVYHHAMFDKMGYKAKKQFKKEFRNYPFFMKRAVNRFYAISLVGTFAIATGSLIFAVLQDSAILQRIDAHQAQVHQLIQKQSEQIRLGLPITLPPSPTIHPFGGLVSFVFLIAGSLLTFYLLNKYTTVFGTFAWKKRAIVWAHKHRFEVCEHCLAPIGQLEYNTSHPHDSPHESLHCPHCHHTIDKDRFREKWNRSMHFFLGSLYEHPFYIRRARRRARVFYILSIPIGIILEWSIFRHAPNPVVMGLAGGIAPFIPAIILAMWAEKKLCWYNTFACRWKAIELAHQHNMEICPCCTYPFEQLQEQQGNCPECGQAYDKQEVRRQWKFASLSMLNPSFLNTKCFESLCFEWKLWKDEDILSTTLKNQNKQLAWCEKHIPVKT